MKEIVKIISSFLELDLTAHSTKIENFSKSAHEAEQPIGKLETEELEIVRMYDQKSKSGKDVYFRQ
jgi:hypothetical protein